MDCNETELNFVAIGRAPVCDNIPLLLSRCDVGGGVLNASLSPTQDTWGGGAILRRQRDDSGNSAEYGPCNFDIGSKGQIGNQVPWEKWSFV